MLLDNSIMGAFGASLNWGTGGLYFANYIIKVKAMHRIQNSTHPTQVAQCSVVAVVDNNAVGTSTSDQEMLHPTT